MEIMYRLEYTKRAVKDIQKIKAAKLDTKTIKLCFSLSQNPKPINSKELNRDLKGKRSIRINIQHRLVYEVCEEKKIIKILSMWGHYDD
jgi:Txe/YoeB family toxin of toxin-antitoxin system